MSTDASAVLLSLVDADVVVDVIALVVVVSAVCLLVVIFADVVAVVLVMLFDPFLPDVVVDNDEIDVEDEEKAVLDVLQDAA